MKKLIFPKFLLSYLFLFLLFRKDNEISTEQSKEIQTLKNIIFFLQENWTNSGLWEWHNDWLD